MLEDRHGCRSRSIGKAEGLSDMKKKNKTEKRNILKHIRTFEYTFFFAFITMVYCVQIYHIYHNVRF